MGCAPSMLVGKSLSSSDEPKQERNTNHRVRQLCHFTITKTETQDKLMWLYDWATAKRCLKFNFNVNFYVCSGEVEWIFKFFLNSRSVLFVWIYNEW